MKKLLIILLALCFAAGICACKKDKTPDINSSGSTPDKKQPIVTRKGIEQMAPIIEGLIYSSELGDYSAKNKEYVWSTFAYVLSNYGYGTLGEVAASGAAGADKDVVPAPKQQVMTKAEAEKLMHACFGEDAKLPKGGFDEYFTEADGIYTLKDTSETEKLSVSAIRVTASSGKAAVRLSNSDEAKEKMFNVYFEQSTDEGSPYPVNITMLKESRFS